MEGARVIIYDLRIDQAILKQVEQRWYLSKVRSRIFFV